MNPLSAKKSTPYAGLIARRTDGSPTMWMAPSTPRVPNQSTMTGPNTRPMRAVPLRWTANRPMRITIEIGITQSSRLDVATAVPSTADRTEIAGVIIPSP